MSKARDMVLTEGYGDLVGHLSATDRARFDELCEACDKAWAAYDEDGDGWGDDQEDRLYVAAMAADTALYAWIDKVGGAT